MVKSVKITKEESDRVEELFYSYNALLELISKFDTKNEVYADLITELKHTKYLLEHEKDTVSNKYLGKDNTNYTFNFITNELEAEY